MNFFKQRIFEKKYLYIYILLLVQVINPVNILPKAAAQEMHASQATEKKAKKTSVRDAFWQNTDGKAITRAYIGDTVYLTALLKNYEGNAINIQIWEKDFTNSDDLIQEINNVELTKSKVHRDEKELKLEWELAYARDNEDKSSAQELEEYGYTRPEYYFMFQDSEGREIQHHSSLVLECMDKVEFECECKEEVVFSPARIYYILHPDGRIAGKPHLKRSQSFAAENADLATDYYLLGVSELVLQKYSPQRYSPIIFIQTNNAVDVDESVYQKVRDIYERISDVYKSKGSSGKPRLLRSVQIKNLAQYIAATGNLATEEYLYQITEDDLNYAHLVRNYLKRNGLPEFESEVQGIMRKLIIEAMSTVCPLAADLEYLPKSSYFLLLPPEGYGFGRGYSSTILE